MSSAVEQLAAAQNGTLDPVEASARLEAMWSLPDAGVRILSARITGQGRDASCEIRLSSGETMVFERLGDIAAGTALVSELASCAGVAVNLKPMQRLESIVLLRALAERQAGETADSIARWWGVEFLGVCQQIEVDMADQGDRWGVFERLSGCDPAAAARELGSSIARHMLVPVDPTGMRYVRVGWYQAYVRQLDGLVTSTQIVARMLRVGWQRRGSEGRIGARRPGMKGQTNLKFLLVPQGWEDLPDDPITAGNRSTRETLEASRARDICITNGYQGEEGHP